MSFVEVVVSQLAVKAKRNRVSLQSRKQLAGAGDDEEGEEEDEAEAEAVAERRFGIEEEHDELDRENLQVSELAFIRSFQSVS